MKKLLLGIAMAFGAAYAQPVSKLNGMTIYMHRQHVDDGHVGGFNGLKALLQQNVAAYGYKLEISDNPLTEQQLNALFGRLYKIGSGKPANGIDIMIFSQGEGDWNVTGNPFVSGVDTRMKQVNEHVRAGGGLVITHAAAGRQISRSGWLFGAKLMTDWFQDEYFASSSVGGNAGHFSSGTLGTTTFDEETLPTKDSSAYFVRKLMLLDKISKGYGMPIQTDQVRGEWYHFNGGYKWEGQLGGKVTNSSNKFQPAEVRGNMGFPDSGIGPSRMFTILTKVQGASYSPANLRRASVWGREVGPGNFDPKASATNGRFVYFNPGHSENEYTLAGGWMGNLYLSMLRWVAKDDRGCTYQPSPNYNPLATVWEPTTNGKDCTVVSVIPKDGSALQNSEVTLGRLSNLQNGIGISIDASGAHVISVVDIRGQSRFRKVGNGAHEYSVSGLERGFYVVKVSVDGKAVVKNIRII